MCGQKSEIVESHVWPRFAYKAYASDLDRGGEFVDLMKMRPHNWQYKFNWFCSQCEGRFSENYASRFCRNLADGDLPEYEYDIQLLSFLVSVSFRLVKFVYGTRLLDDAVIPAMKAWKDFLLGKKRDVGQFTQHLFVLGGGPQALGCKLDGERRYIYGMIGPLHLFGVLNRRSLGLSELRVLDQSRVLVRGGTLQPVTQFRVGTNITMSLMKYLCKIEKGMFNKVQLFEERNARYVNKLAETYGTGGPRRGGRRDSLGL